MRHKGGKKTAAGLPAGMILPGMVSGLLVLAAAAALAAVLLAVSGGIFQISELHPRAGEEAGGGIAVETTATESTAAEWVATESTAEESLATGSSTTENLATGALFPLKAAARSATVSDQIVSEGNLSRYVRNLQVTVRKTQEERYEIRITGKVKGPYRTSDTSYHYYWGPFLAFTSYGQKAAPGCTSNDMQPGGTEYYHIAPDAYHTYSLMAEYRMKRFINQTGMLCEPKNSFRRGGTIIGYVAPDHRWTDDDCDFETVNIAKVVSYSNNTPPEEVNGSSDFDLDLRLEIEDLHDSVTGLYVGIFEYNYYSGAGTDASASYEVSDNLRDCSALLESAKRGSVRITFDPGKGSGGPGTVELTPGSAYSPAAPNPPVGNHFLRWDGWNGTVPAADTVYRAVYEENHYHVRFEAGGQSYQNIAYSETKHTFPEYSKKGYQLTAWRLKE